MSDFDFWARTSTWSGEHAVLLSMEREPNIEFDNYIAGLQDFQRRESPFLVTFTNTVALLEDAMEAGIVPRKGNVLQVVEWFEKFNLPFPIELQQKIKQFHSLGEREINRPVSKQEKNTLLKLIAAMAIGGYRFDPSAARNQATADIANDLNLLGLEMDQKTILKWIRDACDLVPDRDP